MINFSEALNSLRFKFCAKRITKTKHNTFRT